LRIAENKVDIGFVELERDDVSDVRERPDPIPSVPDPFEFSLPLSAKGD